MEVISRHIKHLSRLIDDLLDVSRITRGKIRLRKEVVDLTPIINSAVDAMRPKVEERQHELTVAATSGDCWVEVDSMRLEQILTNLLSNAARYTEKGGKIWVSAEREGKDVFVRVRDSGIGIAPERLTQIFELFTQGDHSLARAEGGLGIGLTVARSLAELQGGSVSARSDGPGMGSEFTVRLPGVNPPLASSTKTGMREPAGTSRRVLIVDDNVDLANGLARLLGLLGHSVHVAHDGKEAIEAARGFEPQVVLLDIGLPTMDGYQVAREIRMQEFGKSARIIAITGYGQEEDRRRSYEAGFDHHLVKPIDFNSLTTLFASPGCA
jgi:CheY-like chemotaxis protein/anti-sigma regulatory factor (Ser/Thr protein kinase)